jgi:hypothetical protein
MSWLGLSPLQVAVLWAAVGAVALWLYRRSRQPVKRVVSSLRFWVSDMAAPQPRRRLREPWAFLLQLLFLLLAILALADLRVGVPIESRNVVVIVDTSVWAQARPPGEASVFERERREATRLVDALPAGDRVLILRADVDVASVLPFTTDHVALRRAIANLRTSSGAANLPRAVEAARAALSGSRRGLIVYVGPGMLDEQQEARLEEVRRSLDAGDRGSRPQFLVRLVKGVAPGPNRGITGVAIQRDQTRPEQWHVLTKVQNYGSSASTASVMFSVDGQQVRQRSIALGPQESLDVREDIVVSEGGLLDAEISPPDWLAADDRAAVSVPPFHPVRVQVTTDRPGFTRAMRGVLDAHPYVRTAMRRPDAVAGAPIDITIHDGGPVPDRPAPNSIWFVSGAKAPAAAMRVASWNGQHPVTRWVHTRDVSVRHRAPIETQPDDIVLASGPGGEPLIVARDRDGGKSLIVGFDPGDSNVAQEAAFPLLMAGAIEWMAPSVVDTAESLAAGDLEIPGPVTRAMTPSNKVASLVSEGALVHLLAREAGSYRLVTPTGGRVLAVNVPALPGQVWKPTPQELAGVELEGATDTTSNLWRWLVALSLIAVWVEWRLFLAAK